MNKLKLLPAAVAAATFALAAAPSTVLAQGFALEEIVVTARKKEETMQDIPVAVSSFGAEDLNAYNMTQTQELAAFTPSLFIEPNAANNLSSAKTTIRGQVQADTLMTLDPSVGWYIDDVYLARTAGTQTSMFDLQRVEILKGPQGTLYGRNTTGGAIKLITTKADPSTGVTGFVNAGIGNFGAWKVGGAVNLPIIEDKLAVRVTAQTDQVDDGFGEMNIEQNSIAGLYPGNEVLNAPSETRDAGQKDQELQRINATYNVTDDLTLMASFEKNEFYANALLANYVTQTGGDFYEKSANMLQEVWTDAETGSLTAEYDINDNLTTKLVYGWRSMETAVLSDVDGSTLPLNYFLKPLEQEADQISLEWQIGGSAMEDKFDWLTGLYYFEEEGKDFSTSNGIGDLLGRGMLYGTYNATIERNISRSAFFNGTLHLTDTVNFTGGLRYTRDTKPVSVNAEVGFMDGSTACRFDETSAPNADVSTCTWGDSTSYEYMSWTAGFDWMINDDLLSYIKHSSASRAGGQNLRGLGLVDTDVNGNPIAPINTFDAFDPETVKDIELGMKGQFLDNTLQVNAAYFHMWYDDVQTSALLPTDAGLTTFVANTSAAQYDGVEVEVKWVVTDNFMLQGTLGKLDWRYADSQDFTSGAPDLEYTLRANYLVPMSWADLILDLNYSYRGEFIPNASVDRSVLEASDAMVDSVDLIGARATFDMSSLGLSVALWGTNLTDEEYTLSPLVLSTAAKLYAMGVGAPRTFGVEATYSF